MTGLENNTTGATGSDTYLYDPYGDNEKVAPTNPADPTPPTDDLGLSSAAQDNPFRFEGFYYDSGVKSYDMQAREYRPDSGHFLTQDRFESAIADDLLQADPLTQNRYAFGGGNPVNNVEFDGHGFLDSALRGVNALVSTALRVIHRAVPQAPARSTAPTAERNAPISNNCNCGHFPGGAPPPPVQFNRQGFAPAGQCTSFNPVSGSCDLGLGSRTPGGVPKGHPPKDPQMLLFIGTLWFGGVGGEADVVVQGAEHAPSLVRALDASTTATAEGGPHLIAGGGAKGA